MRKRVLGNLLLVGKGMAMGAADVVPGVSGGTIALITGIYEKLIHSIKSIDHHTIRILKNKGLLAAWNSINGNFLFTLFLGIGISILSLAKLISFLLETYPILVWGFFFGLILASAFFVGKRVKLWRPAPVIGIIAGTALAWFVTTLPPLGTTEATWFVFVSGMIAICAMILPGISGSFILLLLGSYEFILNAVKDMKVLTIAVFGGGCVVGLLSFSKLLNWMFQRYHDLTIALMTGFLIGSLNKVWPWKTPLETKMVDGEEKVLLEENILPGDFALQAGQDPQTAYSIGLAATAIILVLLLERSGKNNG